jgi:CRP-like cAMP-binding protein
MSEAAMSARVARQIFLRSMTATRAMMFASGTLANIMEDRFFAKGTTIYRKGEAPEDIYFVVSGMVHLIGEANEAPWVMDARSVIGIIDASLERPRTRDAIATTDVHVLRLAADDYLEMLEDSFEQQRAVLLNVSGMVRSVVAELVPSGGFPEPAEDAYQSGNDARALNPVERMLALRSIPAFQNANIQTLAILLEKIEDLRYPPGDLALRPGGVNGSLLLVARGVLEWTRTEPQLSARFGPRTIVGGIGSYNEDTSGSRLRALTPSLLMRLSQDDLLDVMEDHFDLTRSVLRHTTLERERLAILKSTKRPS